MAGCAYRGEANLQARVAETRPLAIYLCEGLETSAGEIARVSRKERILSAARHSRADLIVTTEKDRMRLGPARFPVPLFALRIRLVPRREEELWSFVCGRLFPSSRAVSPLAGL